MKRPASVGNGCKYIVEDIEPGQFGSEHNHTHPRKQVGLSDAQKLIVDECKARDQGAPKQVIAEFCRTNNIYKNYLKM